MATVARVTGAGVVLMHMRGRPNTMQTGDLSCDNITQHVLDHLRERVETLVGSGINEHAICIDPGIGFGKSTEQNLKLISELSAFSELGRPILLGISRKSVLGNVTGRSVNRRGAAECATHAVGVMVGAHIFRVHDVAAARDVVLMMDALGQFRGAA